ncbi:hypothetical protein CC86DRAFT_378977 [Ophiobolus disseminans]|uniref:Uncharacterized protein n=1 Tax=Ophiobolus disseminans TaxID=1469910 RepID=A0A6A7ADG8_9PLEO|nr:hypothetical protein CC86DRAFT_378977 [Ophiobolus disseminans]
MRPGTPPNRHLVPTTCNNDPDESPLLVRFARSQSGTSLSARREQAAEAARSSEQLQKFDGSTDKIRIRDSVKGPHSVEFHDNSICDPFWSYSGARFLIAPEEDKSPPYRPKTSSGWCTKDKDGNNFKPMQSFATAEENDDYTDGPHGTLDDQIDPNNPKSGCELKGARQYLEKYTKDLSSGSPDYNAESYAAAVTEKYFMDLCGFKEIIPVVKPDDNPQLIAPSPSPTRALTIVAEAPASKSQPGGSQTALWDKTKWLYFATDYGKPIGCRTNSIKEEEVTEDPTKQLYPLGAFDFQLFGEACQYRNSGTYEGRLLCGGGEIACTVDPGGRTNPPASKKDPAANVYLPILAGWVARSVLTLAGCV